MIRPEEIKTDILLIMGMLPEWDWTRDGIEEEIWGTQLPLCKKYIRLALSDLLAEGHIILGEPIRRNRWTTFKTFRLAPRPCLPPSRV